VPEPFTALISELIDHRPNMNTATNPHARWLFPGRRVGQPLNVATMLQHLRDRKKLKLARYHPANRARVRAELDAVRDGRGSTVFDWLVEIFEAEAPGRLRLC
jgi:hypothetical protein